MVAGQPINLRLLEYMRDIHADIVHIHHPNPYALWAFIHSEHPGKWIVRICPDCLQYIYVVDL